MKSKNQPGRLVLVLMALGLTMGLVLVTQANAQERQQAERQIYNTGPRTMDDSNLDSFTEAELEAYCNCYAERVLEQVLEISKRDVKRISSMEDSRSRAVAASNFGTGDRYTTKKRKPARKDARQCRRLAKTFR